MRQLIGVFLFAAVIGAVLAGGWAQRAGGAMAAAGVTTMPAGCCGRPLELAGQVYVDVVAALGDGAGGVAGGAVAEYLRTEVYGGELAARVELPAGVYTVEITGSENKFAAAGRRVFSVAALSGGRMPAATTTGDGMGGMQDGMMGGNGMGAGGGAVPVKLEGGVRTEIAKDVDLFKLAGGAGKAYIIKGTVKHGGGILEIELKGSVGDAKFSSIKILNDKGNKEAWLFAEDVAEMLKLPDVAPVVAGPVIYKDASAALEKRAADLVKRMTLREKVGQLQNSASSISRLDVPSYDYWSECLHGVARNGVATVFPQAIGMSATFDPELLHTAGDVIATEARAKYNGRTVGIYDFYGGRYKGLTFWSPNINLFRDPRWGRGQETYGEDPILTGTMAVAFIKGLQGDDPKYLKVVATAKHFAVHSGPDTLRHEFNAAPPMRDFYESYLPHFEMAVREGGVYSVMGAYNRVYGTPACESELLLRDILRRSWGFQGYVVSDCSAISDIWRNHKTEPDAAAASAAAVLAGCDLECGRDYAGLPTAVDKNLIGEGAIDRALQRVLLSRFKLGLFDPPEMVKYSGIKASENDTPEHGALALRMARESMVLLKNDGILPLAKSLRKVAIVGPNADGVLPLVGNYNGTPSAPVTVLAGIKSVYGGEVVHVRGCDNAPREGMWQLVPDVCLRPAGGSIGETGLKAEHFSSSDLTGSAVTVRTEKQLDFKGPIEWTVAGMPTTSGSSRWSGDFVAPADGEYRLTVTGMTSCRFTVNGKKVFDQWGGGLMAGMYSEMEGEGMTEGDGTLESEGMGEGDGVAATTATAPAVETAAGSEPVTVASGEAVMRLKAGQAVPVVVETQQYGGGLDLQLVWDRGDLDLSAAAAARVKDADVIVYVGGLDGRMEAEENDIRGYFKGFDKGDRVTLELPECQEKMIEALAATGKPVVVVNMTGGAVALPWVAEHVQGIMQAWYPGQAGGRAVAEVLFGEVNPSGRLPVTFYRATADLPAFTDYAMAGHTYRYFSGTPLWAFGHGLSYTTFKYGTVGVDKAVVSAADSVMVSVEVTNTGARDGDEVVQIYAQAAKAGAGDARERLVGFKRVAVRAGQTVKVEVAVPVVRLRNWDVGKGAYVVPAGVWRMMAGGSSADIRGVREIVVK